MIKKYETKGLGINFVGTIILSVFHEELTKLTLRLKLNGNIYTDLFIKIPKPLILSFSTKGMLSQINGFSIKLLSSVMKFH